MTNENVLTAKLAAFKTEYGSIIYLGHVPSSPEYVQVSEFTEVQFQPLSTDAIIAGQIAALDAQEEKLRAEFVAAFDDIQRKKSELLALPNMDTAK